jgi:hypothetical protein
LQDLNEDPKKHKFKFEGIVVDKSLIDRDPKYIFDYYSQKREKVKGNALKREVVFNFTSKQNKNQVIPNQITNNTNASNIFSAPDGTSEGKQDFIPSSKSKIINSASLKNENEKQAEGQLQDMKMELHKYKNQLNNLMDTHKNLKSRVEMEKSRDIQSNVNCKI